MKTLFNLLKTALIVFGIVMSTSPAPASAGASCLQAIRYSIMNGEALRLCQGSYNTGPADCFNATYRSQVPLGIAVGLCIGAADSTPYECAMETSRRRFNLNAHTVALLCAKARNMDPIECYARGNFSAVGVAVHSCKQNDYRLSDDPFTWAPLRF